MAKCVSCSGSVGFSAPLGLCPSCYAARKEHRDAPVMISREMMTTLPTLPGHAVLQNCGVVSVLTATSGWTAAAKGNEALGNAWQELSVAAGKQEGANAVVGIAAAPFAAKGGITSVVGGEAVGILITGSAVRVSSAEA